MQFDPHQGYGEVHGVEGVRYEQGGHLFAANGAEVKLIEDDSGARVEIIGAPLSHPISLPTELPPPAPDGLRDRHWREIKALVEANGGVWTNKQDGINYLEGRA